MQQTGFSTGGFMLIALTTATKVNLPETGSARLEGERGAVGYADQMLDRMAILEPGRELTPEEATTLHVSELVKTASRTNLYTDVLKKGT